MCLLTGKHVVNGNPTEEPFPEGNETIMFGKAAQSQMYLFRIGPVWGPS